MTIWPLKPIPDNIDKQLLIDRINLGCSVDQNFLDKRYSNILSIFLLKGIEIPQEVLDGNIASNDTSSDFTFYDPMVPHSVLRSLVKTAVGNGNDIECFDCTSNAKYVRELLLGLDGPDTLPMYSGYNDGRLIGYIPKTLITDSIKDDVRYGDEDGVHLAARHCRTLKLFCRHNTLNPEYSSSDARYNGKLVQFLIEEIVKHNPYYPEELPQVLAGRYSPLITTMRQFYIACPKYVLDLLKQLGAYEKIEDACNKKEKEEEIAYRHYYKDKGSVL